MSAPIIAEELAAAVARVRATPLPEKVRKAVSMMLVDIGGLAVHIAARVTAQAGAGEIVATRTVAELLGASEYHLQDRGEHELKGVPGTWQLYTVTAPQPPHAAS